MNFNDITPGVTKLVAFLQSLGFNTTDSGDGVVNTDLCMEDALDFPHVFMTVPIDQMWQESHRLFDLMRYGQRDTEAHNARIRTSFGDRLPPIVWTRRPVDFDPSKDRSGPVPHIEVTYNPFDQHAVLALVNVNDANVWGPDDTLTRRRLEYKLAYAEQWLASPPLREAAPGDLNWHGFFADLKAECIAKLAPGADPDGLDDLPPF